MVFTVKAVEAVLGVVVVPSAEAGKRPLLSEVTPPRLPLLTTTELAPSWMPVMLSLKHFQLTFPESPERITLFMLRSLSLDSHVMDKLMEVGKNFVIKHIQVSIKYTSTFLLDPKIQKTICL